MNILLADDHALLRAGLRAILDAQPDMHVTAEAVDGRDALTLAADLLPDVILLDVAMPGLNGLEALPRLLEVSPQSQIIVLSMHATEEYVVRALRSGAIGYLLKDSPPAELLSAVRAAGRGERYLCPPLTAEVVDDYLRRTGEEGSILDLLTPREREILQLLAEGKSTQAIANRLGLSPKTVETHRANLMDKLNLHNIASLTRFAIRAGLVSSQ